MLIRSSALQLKASLRLEDLPVDILIELQKHLDAKDIFALRKSCKALHAITQQRMVWLNALRRMCRRHGVFAPSFPLGDMSIMEIEHVSLCPSRLSSLIHNNTRLRSFGTRIFRPRTPAVFKKFDFEGELDCLSAFLIPGGRFLVVNSLRHGICLCDLGIHAGKVPNVTPVAVIPTLNLRSLCTGPTQDGLGIVLISYSASISDRALRAYEVYPCTSNPQFTLVGLLTCPKEAIDIGRRPALFGDLLAFDALPDGSVVVWNVRLGAAIAWRYSEAINDILIFDDGIILVQESKLTVWDIPPLKPLREDTYEIVTHTPKYEIIHPIPPGQPSVSSVLGPWLSGIDPPTSLAIFRPKDKKSVMACYALKSIPSPTDPSSSRVLPIETWIVLDLPTEVMDGSHIKSSGKLQYCEDELCYMSLSQNRAIVSLTAPPTSLNGPSYSITASLPRASLEPNSWSFCAASGRLVVVEEVGVIHIRDFLVPPPS